MNYCHRCCWPGNAVPLFHTAAGVHCRFCLYGPDPIPKGNIRHG